MLSNGECDLHPQEHPIVDKDLRLDDFQSLDDKERQEQLVAVFHVTSRHDHQ